MAFFNKITLQTAGLLPAPQFSKRGSKSSLPNNCIRRSRRLAGVEAEVVPGDLGGRAKKKAMRSLDIIDEHEGITQQAQDEYAKLFQQPLSASHLEALTALFNWRLPEELELMGEDVMVV